MGFEVKSTEKWKPSYNFGLTTLLNEKKIDKAYGVYLGEHKLKQGDIDIWSIGELNSVLNFLLV